MFRTQNPYHDSFLGMWKVPKRGEPHPTEDSLFPWAHEESLRQWGTDHPLSAADWQLKSRIERYEALRKLAAMTGNKGPRDRSRGPIQNELLKQKAAVEPPAAPAAVGSSFADDRTWMDAGSLREALPMAPARGRSPVSPIQEPTVKNESEPKVSYPRQCPK